MENLEPLANEAKAAIAAAEDGATLEQLRVDYLGKKGQITALLKGLGKLSAEERPAAGARINVVKQELQELIGARKQRWKSAPWMRGLRRRRLTSPARSRPEHRWHSPGDPHHRAHGGFLRAIGFEVVEGPEIEDDYHNFEALNIPGAPPGPGHARHLLCGRAHGTADPHLTGAGAGDGEPANRRCV